MNPTKGEETDRITENDLPQEFVLKLLGQHETRGLWGIKNTREPVDLMVRHAKTRELSLPIVQLVITKEGIFMSPIVCKLDNSTRKMATASAVPTGKRSSESQSPDIETVYPNRSVALSSYLKMMKDPDWKGSGEKNPAGKTGKFHFLSGKKGEEKKIWKASATDLRLLDKLSRFDWKQTGIFFFGIDTISYGVQDLIFTRVFSMIVVLDRRTRNLIGANSSFLCHAFVCESRTTARRVTHALAAAFRAYGRAVKFSREIRTPEDSREEEKPRKFTIELRPPSEIAFDQSEA